MERVINYGDGDVNIHVTDGLGEFKQTLNILEEEHNFVCVEGIDKGTFG